MEAALDQNAAESHLVFHSSLNTPQGSLRLLRTHDNSVDGAYLRAQLTTLQLRKAYLRRRFVLFALAVSLMPTPW